MAESGRPESLATKYELQEELGRGGMGVVHRARERSSGREVAIKLIALTDIDREARQRFQREAELAATLRHPGILTVHDAGEEPGRAWIACELVPEARALDEEWGDLSQARRVALVRDAARALGHAHARGVVHRDVKGQNLLVGSDGRLRVTDFGLALLRGGTRITDTGTLLGTPRAMAPEQVRGERERVGPWTDVWALGVLLYEALSGKRPFEGKSLVDTMRRIVELEPPRPGSLASVSEALEAVCVRALAKKPEERWPDGEAMAVALEVAMAGSAQRSRTGVLAFALVALAAGAAFHQRERWQPALEQALAGAAPASTRGESMASAMPASSDRPPPAAVSTASEELPEGVRRVLQRAEGALKDGNTALARKQLEDAQVHPAVVRRLARLLREDGAEGEADRELAARLDLVAEALARYAAAPSETSADRAAIQAEADGISLANLDPLDPAQNRELQAMLWLERRAERHANDLAAPLWRTCARRWGSLASAKRLATYLEDLAAPASQREALVWWLVRARSPATSTADRASALHAACQAARKLGFEELGWPLELAQASVRSCKTALNLRTLAGFLSKKDRDAARRVYAESLALQDDPSTRELLSSLEPTKGE